MAVADYKALVQSLYISYFGRPADTVGLANFSAQLDLLKAPTDVAGLSAAYSKTPALKTLIDSFGTSPESVALYGTDNMAFVTAIYNNLLNRAPDFDGLLFWYNAITTGGLSKGNAALSIMQGALANTSVQGKLDAAVVTAKVTIATNFTTAIDTGEELSAYNGNAAAATARDMLKTVTATTVPAAFQTTVDATIASIVSASIPVINLTLTTGLDTLVGAGGNDIFNATIGGAAGVATLTVLDSIDGKGGNNALNLSDLSGGSTLPLGLAISNVQTLNLQSAGAAIIDTTAGGFTGLTALNVKVSTGADVIVAGSGTAVSAVNAAGTTQITGGASQTVAAAGGVTLAGSVGAVTVVDSAQGVANSKIDGGTSVTVTTTETGAGTKGNLTIGGTVKPTGAITVTENLAGVAADLVGGNITITGGTTVNVKVNATHDTTLVGTESTVGTISVTGGAATTSVTVAQTAEVAGKAAVTAVAAVKQSSSLVFAAMTAGQTLIIDGLTFTAPNGATAAQAAAAFANLAAGATNGNSTIGVYSGKLSASYTSGAATADTVVFTNPTTTSAALSVNAGTATPPTATATALVANVNAAAGVAGVTNGVVTIADGAGTTNTITTVSVDGYANTSSVTSNALTSLSLSNANNKSFSVSNNAATTLALTLNKVDGTSTINLDAGGAKYTTLNLNTGTGTASKVVFTAAAVTALNVSGTKVIDFSTTNFAALKTVAVSGSAGATLASVASVTGIDTTATTGAVTVTNFDGTVATYTGGAGADTVTTIGTNVSKAISLGAGNDSITLGSGTTALTATVDGGIGTDTLTMVAADAATASLTGTFATKAIGFEVLRLTGATGTQSVSVGTLGAYNSVTSTGIAAAGALTLDGFTTGGTLTLTGNAGAAGGYIVSGTTFATPTTDVFNVVLANSNTTVVGGIVTANKIETINVAVSGTQSTASSVTLVGDSVTKIVATGTNLNLTSANTTVTSVDGSALTGALTYTTAGTTAQIVKGGAGNNVLTALASAATADQLFGGVGADTLVANKGLNQLTGGAGADWFVVSNASANLNTYSTITDAVKGDMVVLKDLGVETFGATKLTLAPTAVFQDYANAVVVAGGAAAATAGYIGWFQFGGDTYIVESLHDGVVTTDFVNGVDVVVKLTGLVDLSTASLNDAGANSNGVFTAGAPILLLG